MKAVPDPRRQGAQAIAKRLHDAGHQTLFCGGCVRDRLLGRDAADIDLATAATPEEVAALFPESVLVGAQFGVVVLPRPTGDVEVATFRADGRYIDGRRPEGVVFSDPPTDAARRDFTINGLFEDPLTGEVLDFVGGQADLRSRLLRAIGDPYARFEEDHLRVLRAARFAAQLGFALEPKTAQAVRDLAPKVARVAPERIRSELLKLLRDGRGRGLRLLRDLKLLPIVLPEVDAMQGVPQPPRWHAEGDVFVHTCLVLDGLVLDGLKEDLPDTPHAEAALVWAALLHDVAKPPCKTVDATGRIRFNRHDAVGTKMAAAVLERLRSDNATRHQVEDLVGQHMRIASTPQMRPARLRRFLAREDLELQLRLHAADSGAAHGSREILDFLTEARARLGSEPQLPPPLLRGADLLALGYAPGPRMGEMLRWVQDEQLEGRLTTAEEAARAVQEKYPPNGDADEPHATT